jgi:hypothetical protein
MSGKKQLKSAHLVEIKEVLDKYAELFESITYKHVPRTENKEADRLAQYVTNHFEYNKRAKKLHEKDDLGKDSNDE